MGLFSKKNGYEAAALELEVQEQRRRERSQAQQSQAKTPSSSSSKAPSTSSTVSPSAAQAPAPAKAEAQSAALPLTYGIDDVIQLMRDLPDSKKEMVILIVQKTLLSAKIDIKTILEKATRKIDNLQNRNDKLRTEIRDLEELIIQKKSDVERLRKDIEETQSVRQNFEAVFLRGGRAITAAVSREEETFAAPVRSEGPARISS